MHADPAAAKRVPLRVACVLLLALFGAAAFLGYRHATRLPDLSAHEDRIREAARAFQLDPALLAALVAAESGGDPEAVSRVGAVGLCQLMPATAADEARRLGMDDYTSALLTDPDVNIRLGASYLRRQLRTFQGHRAFALGAYNGGGVNVRRWRRRAPDVSARDVIRREGFPETRGFVERVLSFRKRYAN